LFPTLFGGNQEGAGNPNDPKEVMPMHGWTGTVLRVNLSTKTITTEDLDPDAAKAFIGGRGLGVKYLLDSVDPGCDPLGPENAMIMATGPLTGTAAPTGARYMVVAKSPLTGAVTASNSGGRFPAEVKKRRC
jgi:aldehyde:ferredoxin oxidoreductase